MAIKSPFQPRTPVVLPIVRKNVADLNSISVTDSEKVPRSIPIRPRQERGKAFKFLRRIPLDLILVVLIWYYVGVGSICTSKILLSGEWSLPPLVLTMQQLVLSSSMLHLHLRATGGLQKMPRLREESHSGHIFSLDYNLVMMGIFNTVDFFCTNTSFSLASASFVETIKACEPITTTAIALFYGIEILRLPEAFSIMLMVAGVIFSTMGEAASPDEDGPSSETDEELELRWHQSILTCMVVLAANLCFGFRIKSQKMLRGHAEWRPVGDAHLLMWMQQIGAVALIGPIMVFEFQGIVQRTMDTSWVELRSYCLLAIANAAAYGVYSVAGSYVLTRVSIAHYTGFSCLRRMNAILCTSIAFGVPITLIGAFGILLSLSGFIGFSTYRHSHPPSSDVRVTAPTSPSAKLSYKTWKTANV